MKIDTTYLKRCILALDGAYHSLEKYSVDLVSATNLSNIIENSDAS